MQTDGNLVLYTSKGKAIWASHTAGTGSHNSVHMQNDGNLVIYNGAGKKVWASGTTQTIMVGGGTIGSGRQLINKYRDQFGVVPTRLVMRPDGDLVVAWGSQITWSTHTHVHGAMPP